MIDPKDDEELDNVRPILLLADDSVTIRKVVEFTFANEDIEVVTAADAQSAMLKFVEVQPDIVLVDVGLPDVSGYQICEMIKNDDATKHLPVLLLVGSFEPFDQDEAERVGADGFLTKPFHSTKDLVIRVNDLLGRSNGMEEAALAVPALTEDIDSLYSSSFAETAKLEEYDTLEEPFGDSVMDDEMIETSYPSEPFEENILSFERAGERTSEFDWSPESMVGDAGPIQKAQASFEAKFVFEEDGDHDSSHGDTSGATTLEDIPPMPEVKALAEPSPEFISLVVGRVIERLSDKVVREIARDAVPRIAEKLIREALNQEKK